MAAKDGDMIRVSKDLYPILKAAADQNRRSIAGQLDYVLRKVYGVLPVGALEADEVIKQIQAGKEHDITPNAILKEGNGTEG